MDRSRFLFAACVLAAGVGACSSTADSVTGTPAFQLSADDSALAAAVPAAQAAVSDLDVLNSMAATLNFQAVPASAAPSYDQSAIATAWAAASSCTLDSATFLWTCPSTTANGLSLVRVLEFFDSTGAPMLKFNDTTTASVRVQATVSGVRTLANGADTVSRVRDLTASGLLGRNSTRIWNGTGNGTSGAYWADSAASRTAHTTSSTTFTNIVVDLPRSTHPYPASGTIARAVSGTGTLTRNGATRTFTITRTVTITFNGTEFVPMVVGDDTFTLDLATGKVVKH